MVESIKELRIICQKSRESSSYQMSWSQKKLYRSISIYITKLCLKIGITANQATFISFCIAIMAGIFLTFGHALYWIIGALLVYLFSLFDHVDGEIARYNRSASPTGAYLDAIVGFAMAFIYLPICMCFGIYSALQNTAVLKLGFFVVGSIFLLRSSGLLEYRIHSKTSFSYEDLMRIDSTGKSKLKVLMKWGMLLFGEWFTIMLLVVAIIDLFVSPFIVSHIPFIDSLTVNARYLHLALYGIAMLVAAIIRIVYAIRVGVKLRLI